MMHPIWIPIIAAGIVIASFYFWRLVELVAEEFTEGVD